MARERQNQTIRKAGRPRSDASRAAILSAAWRLVLQGPIADISIAQIAREAGVGKATIYRWWPSRVALICEAFLEEVDATTSVEDRGTAAESIRHHVLRVGENLRGPFGRVARELIVACAQDHDGHEVFAKEFIVPRRRGVGDLIMRGTARGEFRQDLDVETCLDMLYGPMHYRLLVQHQPLTRAFVEQSVDAALRAMFVKPVNGDLR